MHADNDALPLIETNRDRYDLEWLNRDRNGHDWKIRLYQQRRTGLQLALYDRVNTLVRLERSVPGIEGVAQRSSNPKSYALEIAGSHFTGDAGVSHDVTSMAALQHLLDAYLGTAVPNASDPLSEIVGMQSEPINGQDPVAKESAADQRRRRLALAPKFPKQYNVTTTVFDRNPDVIAEVLERAAGVCESCKAAAPFRRAGTGEPYLEVHHRVPLAAGGPDTVENAEALCPNCHRQKHYGKKDDGGVEKTYEVGRRRPN